MSRYIALLSAKLRLLGVYILSYWSAPIIEPAPTHAPPPAKPPSPPRAKRDEFGEFYFRDVILDQLDRYFVILKRMKRSDPEAYDLYSRTGCRVVPRGNFWTPVRNTDREIPPWFLATLPSFGGIVYGADPAAEEHERRGKFLPYVIHFRKYNPRLAPIEVQPVRNGHVYIVTVYWEHLADKKRKTGAPTEFPIWISSSGELRVLRTLERIEVPIRSRRGSDKGQVFHVPQTKWRVNDFFVKWARENSTPVDEYLKWLFIDAVEEYQAAATSMVQVRATKSNTSALFAVNVERTPYFFKDRDVAVGPSGKRRRIFHMVRVHSRVLGDGRQVSVAAHFRGERTFQWNSYRIEITVPGWHHASIADFNVSMVDERAGEPTGDKLVGLREVGAALRRIERNGIGAHHRAHPTRH
jgi:hypothetical protein